MTRTHYYLSSLKNDDSDEWDNDKDEKERQQQEAETSNILVEQIYGTFYTFDTENCAWSMRHMEATLQMNDGKTSVLS